MSMIYRDILQDTEEWYEWRSNFITASIVPALLSASPYETAYEAIQYLRGLRAKKVSEWLTKRGNQLEGSARLCIEKKMGLTLLPVCGESARVKYLAASLDGQDEHGVPHEIKVPHEKQWNDVVNRGRESTAYKMYRWQLLCQMYVAESDVGYLHFYNDEGDKLITFKIERNKDAEALMLNVIKDAWQHKLNGTLPVPSSMDTYVPEGIDAYRLEPYARGFKHAKRQYERARKRFESLDLQRKRIEAEMDISFAPSFKVVSGDDVRISRWAQKPKANLDQFAESVEAKSSLSLEEITQLLERNRKTGVKMTKASIIGQPRYDNEESNRDVHKSNITEFREGEYIPSGDEAESLTISVAFWRPVKEEAESAKKEMLAHKARMDFFANTLNQHGSGFAAVEVKGVKVSRFDRKGSVSINDAIKDISDATGISVHELHEILESTKASASRRYRIKDHYTADVSLVA